MKSTFTGEGEAAECLFALDLPGMTRASWTRAWTCDDRHRVCGDVGLGARREDPPHRSKAWRGQGERSLSKWSEQRGLCELSRCSWWKRLSAGLVPQPSAHLSEVQITMCDLLTEAVAPPDSTLQAQVLAEECPLLTWEANAERLRRCSGPKGSEELRTLQSNEALAPMC